MEQTALMEKRVILLFSLDSLSINLLKRQREGKYIREE